MADRPTSVAPQRPDRLASADAPAREATADEGWVSSTARAAGRTTFELMSLSAGALAFGVLFLAATAVFLYNRLQPQFGDESDNFLGGYLIAHGARLYTDWFTQHMPLPYYVAAVPALFDARSADVYRLFNAAIVLPTILAIVWGFRRRIATPVLYVWAVTAVLAHPLYAGQELLADVYAGLGICVVALSFLAYPNLRFGLWHQAALSLAIFAATQSALVSAYPLLVFGAWYLVVKHVQSRRGPYWQSVREVATFGVIVAVPHLILLAGLALTGSLGPFVDQAIVFNQRYYSRYLLNPSPIGLLHDWEAQYRVFLATVLRQPLSLDGALAWANLAGAVLVARRRGPAFAVAWYLAIGLCHIRDGFHADGYYPLSFFNLALLVEAAVSALARAVRSRAEMPLRALAGAGGAVGLVLAAVFYIGVARLFVPAPAVEYSSPYVPLIRALTDEGEAIWVGPGDPYLYLFVNRMPASAVSYYMPWMADDPELDAWLMRDLDRNQPPVVIYKMTDVIFGQYPTTEWGERLHQFLLRDYEPLDASDPDLRWFFVPKERAAADRALLAGSR